MALCLLNKTAFGLSNQVGDCQIRLAEKGNKSHRLTVSPCHRLLLLPRLLLRFMHDSHIMLRHGKQLRGRNRSVWPRAS